MSKFNALIANEAGEIFDDPDHGFVACSAQHPMIPEEEEMIPLPQGAKFFTMPGFTPLGHNKEIDQIVCMSDPGEMVSAVAAFLPPGYARLFLPGTLYSGPEDKLPLWSYTAVAWKDEQFWVAAAKVDDDIHWNPENYDDTGIDRRIAKKSKRLKDNRLVEQLAHCAKNSHCFAAKNFFYERWECPVPVSPTCNSKCIGCISFQPEKEISASMERLKFIPTVDEIVALCADHLQRAPEALVSFGQGCEGDPIMQADVISEATKRIKAVFPDATLNMNTNASLPDAVKKLAAAGLDTIRVSMNSVIPEQYNAYYRPAGYIYDDVLKSIKIASDVGLYINLNYLIFPGVTDQPKEIENLIKLIKSRGINRIQMKNLCIDPHDYLEKIGFPEEPGVGILEMMSILRAEVPEIEFGYFNKPKEKYNIT